MIGARQPQTKSRAWLITLLRWAAALAVLAVLFHFLPVAPLRSALAKVPPIRFAIILFFYLCAHAVGIAKWRMVVNTAGAQLDVSTSAQCYLGGLFGTLFLSSIICGCVVRMAVGLRRSPRPAAVLAWNVVDRFFDVTAQATLVAIGVILLPGSVPEQFRAIAHNIFLIFGALFVALIFAAVLLRKTIFAGRSRRFLRRLARVRPPPPSARRRPQNSSTGWVSGGAISGAFIFFKRL